jgi:hypothetical protein
LSADDTDCGVRADLAHLLELWDMLPTWRHPDYWKELAATGCASGQDYLLEKMYGVRHLATEYLKSGRNDRTSYELHYIGQHVLSFFDRENQAMFEVLDKLAPSLACEPGHFGRRWATDAVDTAWRLYVPAAGKMNREERAETGNLPPWLDHAAD